MLLGSMCGRYQPLLGHSWDTFERFGLASVSLSLEETSMATIEQRTTREGQTVYRVKVRRKGTPLQTATLARFPSRFNHAEFVTNYSIVGSVPDICGKKVLLTVTLSVQFLTSTAWFYQE